VGYNFIDLLAQPLSSKSYENNKFMTNIIQKPNIEPS